MRGNTRMSHLKLFWVRLLVIAHKREAIGVAGHVRRQSKRPIAHQVHGLCVLCDFFILPIETGGFPANRRCWFQVYCGVSIRVRFLMIGPKRISELADSSAQVHPQPPRPGNGSGVALVASVQRHGLDLLDDQRPDHAGFLVPRYGTIELVCAGGEIDDNGGALTTIE